MITKWTSVNSVISKLLTVMNTDNEDRIYDLIEWCGEAMEKIGSYQQLKTEHIQIHVENFKYPIPCALVNVEGMAIANYKLIYLTGVYDTSSYIEERTSEVGVTEDSLLFNYSYLDPEKVPTENIGLYNYPYGYRINNDCFEFNFTNRKVDLIYQSIILDEKGFPMIPDLASFKEALYCYCLMRLKEPEYFMGTLNLNLWDRLVRNWHLYCAQARGKANMPNADKIESISQQWLRLVPTLNKHQDGFSNNNYLDGRNY